MDRRVRRVLLAAGLGFGGCAAPTEDPAADASSGSTARGPHDDSSDDAEGEEESSEGSSTGANDEGQASTATSDATDAGEDDSSSSSTSTDTGTGTSGDDGSELDDAGTDTSSSTGSVATDAPVISELSIEENPLNTISCFVHWTTDIPASSEVQFGVDDVEFRIGSDEMTTEHRVVVVGMRESANHVIRAISSNAAGSDEVEGSFATGSLPPEIPIVELTANQPEASQSGWTLTNVMVGDTGGFGSSAPSHIVMYDEEGTPVWYYVNGTTADNRGDISAQLTEDDTVVIGPAPNEAPREVDLGGATLWEGPANGGGGSGAMTHEALKISNGEFIVIRDTPNGSGITDVTLEQYSADNEMTWTWTLLDHIEAPSGTSGDWCHANSITVDLEQDWVYVNCRFLGLFKIQRESGEILWHMAGTHNPDLPGDFSFIGTGAQFNDAHDPEMHPDGKILLYDNGGYAGLGGGGNNDFHSRVLEYQVDEQTREAELVWEFPGDFDVDSWYIDDWYAAFWGDADRLENDNVLVTAGLKGTDLQTRIFEVTRAGEIVWEITFPPNQGAYRAQRFEPLAERIE